MSKANTRVAGHELQNEGAAYERGFRLGEHARVRPGYGSGGIGYAVCSCGAKSEVLTSGTQRKQWHREHKQTIQNNSEGKKAS